MSRITIAVDGELVRTVGLAGIIDTEIVLTVSESSLIDTAAEIMSDIGEYFAESKRPLIVGQTIDWGCTLFVARCAGGGHIALDELQLDGESLNADASNAVAIWQEQRAICMRYGSRLLECRFGEKIAISPGVLERDDALEGIRYEGRPGSMTGWYLMTPEYDGSKDGFRSMRPTHTFHVIQARPEITKFLLLDHGFAFKRSDSDERVWFDAKVLESE